MPKRTDIRKILIIGSGPIIISQGCEFDYSGTQACKALKEEGVEVVLVNSNPATIMTDPEMADATYIEPITPEVLEKVIEKERPDALLPTLGGQTGLNTAMKIVENGVLEKYNVKMIGADYDAIKKAEDRDCFKKAMERIGLDLPRSDLAYNMEQAKDALKKIGFPVIIRPSFTLGGTGGGIAKTKKEFERIADLGLKNSMINEILIEESVLGWKEYELEVMRDSKDNVVIVCSIENFDPMGIHTGDSITVAPAQTLTDKEYQKMRDAAIAIIREIGIETGGSNIQFAVNPRDGKMVVIEMNPRVSRSSALASKATGFPIAKIAAKLALGYTLDEIENDITKETPACFEPAIDYCVVKIPRFTFEKFPEAKDILGISMKSVGETMAIGRTFKEALQKGLRGLEIGHSGLDNKLDYREIPDDKLMLRLKEPNASRIFYIKYALQKGMNTDEIVNITKIDPWFIDNIEQIAELEKEIVESSAGGALPMELLKQAKEYGFSDKQIGDLIDSDELFVRRLRKRQRIEAAFKLVDTCAAEFEAYTPYYYSTYETEDETRISIKKKIMILGSGPNRIGQGIEFDYCCCHASFALKELGYETIMVNSNPETVSTDYDTSDKLYFEPLTFEDVMNIIDKEKPDGVIVQFGGQTPLNLAKRLKESGAPIIGTPVESIDKAEDRDKFARLIRKLKINQPANGSAVSKEEAKRIANRIGYPVLVRPSYVLGGRAMKIVYNEKSLEEFIYEAQDASMEHPVLIDKFLEDAVEVDVDAVSDGNLTVIGGIMEHIEEAGVHSGDSACVLPPHTLSDNIIDTIREYTYAISKELNIKGLLNIQFAVKNDIVYVLEVNPRASRTVPFVSKATGTPLAKLAAKVMVGKTLNELGFTKEKNPNHISVKESVLPFSRFSGVDILLGPEMKSTGEVMGIDYSFGIAFYKSQIAAGQILPTGGKVFISVKNDDKRDIVFIAKKLYDMNFEIIATKGTFKVLRSNNIEVEMVGKIGEGDTAILELVSTGQIKLIINTPSGARGRSDMKPIRNSAVMQGIPCITTIQGAQAVVNGIESILKGELSVKSIQNWIPAFAGMTGRYRKQRMYKDWIAILDFGSQYTHLIARRVRECGVYSEIAANDITASALLARAPKAIILSGGPASVISGKSPMCDKDIFNIGVPILGICYGAQLIAKMLGGRVVKAKAREYGKAILKINARDSLFNSLLKKEMVWMSHGDKITVLPGGFKIIGSTGNAKIAAMGDRTRNFYGVQFHPEVVHTPKGKRILRNFIFDISKCKRSWNMHSFVKNSIQTLRDKIGNEKILCALSGGVDSSVLALLLHKAVDKNLTAVFIDNGLLRKDEVNLVKKRFKNHYRINLKTVNARDIFLKALKGVKNPETKRRIIGRLFIKLFEREAEKSGRIKFLAQGTLYPDVIESKSPLGGPSATIKTHHNVGGLPKNLKFELIEPLKELFKDEVRLLGKELGLPDDIIYRQPFPGPGLAVRIIGGVTEERLDILRQADWILMDEIKRAKLYRKLWQSFCVLLPIKTVGVMGDERTYENVTAIRAVTSKDAMTADWAQLPYNLLGEISNRIINEVKGINRVVYDISSKPPSTIEWE